MLNQSFRGPDAGRLAGLALLFFLFIFAFGCRSPKIKATGDISAFAIDETVGGRVSVAVKSRINAESKATRYFWGVTHVYRPERTFSELMRHSARENAGLHVTQVINVTGRDEGLSPAGIENLVAEAGEQDADFLFTASIDSWRQNYVLFFQWSSIKFTITCHSIPDGEKIWTARPDSRRLYGTDRQVLLKALDNIFASARKAAE